MNRIGQSNIKEKKKDKMKQNVLNTTRVVFVRTPCYTTNVSLTGGQYSVVKRHLQLFHPHGVGA